MSVKWVCTAALWAGIKKREKNEEKEEKIFDDHHIQDSVFPNINRI